MLAHSDLTQHSDSGETGSGRSESRRFTIKTILKLSVSNPSKKGSKLAHQIPATKFVLESFGNTRTLFNSNASRFGKYTKLQFTERGHLCGIKTLITILNTIEERVPLWQVELPHILLSFCWHGSGRTTAYATS
jgi:hypothetical protein